MVFRVLGLGVLGFEALGLECCYSVQGVDGLRVSGL